MKITLDNKQLEAVKNVLKFKNKELSSREIKSKPFLNYLYLDSEGNLIMTNGGAALCSTKIKNFEIYDAKEGFYELKGRQLIYCPEDVQKHGYPIHAISPLLKEAKADNIELIDEYVYPAGFCPILHKLSGIWLNPEYFILIPEGDYNIGRFRMFKDEVMERCPVVFQNDTYTCVIMPIDKKSFA